jgi:hypothetical protein
VPAEKPVPYNTKSTKFAERTSLIAQLYISRPSVNFSLTPQEEEEKEEGGKVKRKETERQSVLLLDS